MMLRARGCHSCCCRHGSNSVGFSSSSTSMAGPAAAGGAASHLSIAQRRSLTFDPLRSHQRRQMQAFSVEAEQPLTPDNDSFALPENFCIIESRDAVKDFASLQLDEIGDNITARRNRIFLLMEEVRRLRIQQRLKGGDAPIGEMSEREPEQYLSALPFLPPITEKTLNTYYTFYAAFVAAVISFGGLLAPLLEVKMGLGGTSYVDFVQSMHLPTQLAKVDPIVASFCGGAVGVVSALLVVELNNVKKQQKNRCHYCEGSGYLPCGHCIGSGIDPVTRGPCAYCAGTSKVMCTGCLCTGKTMATEHDPRIDPFD